MADYVDGVEKVYEYTCVMRAEDGTLTREILVAIDDDHAREEASYEFDGECVAVERGEFLYMNEPPKS